MLTGDTDKLFKKYSSSSSSFSVGYTPYSGSYRSNYTSTWKEKNAPLSNTPAWAKDISGLRNEKSTKKSVPEPKRERGFREGDRVKGPHHGEGSVIKVEKKDDGKVIVTVLFDAGKQMRFVEGHSDVVKI